MLLCPASQNEAHLSGSTRTPWRVHEQVSLHNVTRCAHAYRFLGPIGGSHSCLGIWLAVVHFTTVIWDEWWRVRRCNRKGAENGGKTLQSVSMDPVKECRHGDARGDQSAWVPRHPSEKHSRQSSATTKTKYSAKFFFQCLFCVFSVALHW